MARYTPVVLLVGLVAWTVFLLLPHLHRVEALVALISVGAALALGVVGGIWPARWWDEAAVLALGAGFLTAALFLSDVGIVLLFLFVSLAILTYHLLRFRTTISPLSPAFTADESAVRGVRGVFLAVAQRSLLLSTMVFLISLVAVLVTSGLVFGLTLDITAFLLALLLLAILAVLATYSQKPSA